MATVKATIFFEKKFWIGTFERTDKAGYALARHIFGGEPSDHEIHEFVLNHYHELKFGEAKEVTVEIQRMNPKRLQREVRREMSKMKETAQPSTLAQDTMREEIEKKRKRRKVPAVLKNKRVKMNNFLSSKRRGKKNIVDVKFSHHKIEEVRYF